MNRSDKRLLVGLLIVTIGLGLGLMMLSATAKAVDGARGETWGTPSERLPGPEDFVPCEVMPELIHTEEPVYSDSAKANKIEGDVWVKALIDKEGKVREAQVMKTSKHRILDESAIAAALNCRYKPAMQKGKPVSIWVSYKVTFSLD